MSVSSTQNQKSYVLALPSERKNITQVETFLKSIEEFSLLDEFRYYNALIAITEAVNNAIIHGNKCNPDKLATLTVTITTDGMQFNITDCGEGFEPDAVPDPRTKENILLEGGRGVFLIRSLIDDVEYKRTETGMSVTMTVNT